jgi:hypothetical protein
MTPTAYLYRHDSVSPGRPIGMVDVDARGWLWRNASENQVLAHHLPTAALRVYVVPEMGGCAAFSAFCWNDQLVITLGRAPFYLVHDPASGRCKQRPALVEKPIVWYGAKLPRDRLMLCHRFNPGGGGGQACILDAPVAQPRVVPCPYRGDFDWPVVLEDGLAYVFLGDPARLVRFDPASERFIDEIPLPWPEAGVTGRLCHDGVLYAADSAGGRLLPLELATQRWGDPIPHPDFGRVFGYIGPGFKAGGLLHYCLSNYAHRSRLNVDTGEVLLPPAHVPMTVDGRPERFLERLVVFDPGRQKWRDDLVAPAQPDGLPILVYSWSNGADWAITGSLLRSDMPEADGDCAGPWLVLQSSPANGTFKDAG